MSLTTKYGVFYSTSKSEICGNPRRPFWDYEVPTSYSFPSLLYFLLSCTVRTVSHHHHHYRNIILFIYLIHLRQTNPHPPKKRKRKTKNELGTRVRTLRKIDRCTMVVHGKARRGNGIWGEVQVLTCKRQVRETHPMRRIIGFFARDGWGREGWGSDARHHTKYEVRSMLVKG